MLQVSTQWHNASRDQFRYQAYLYANLEVVPPGLREGVEVFSNYTNELSDIGVLVDGKSVLPAPYASLERNRWSLDGTFRVKTSDSSFDDWWSKVSVSEGTPVIQFSFDKPYTFPGMYFKWDKVSGSCPKTIRVVGYDSNRTQKYSVTVENIDSDEGFFESLAMDDTKYVDVEILEWCSEGWRARLLEVMFGLAVFFDSYNNGRILSATQTDRADPLNSKLPAHNLSLVLRNYDKYFDATLNSGMSKYLARQQIMHIQWAFVTAKGVVEYAPKQVYLAEKFDIPANSKEVKMHMTSRIELLDGDFYYGTYTGQPRTLKALAEYVLINSNVPVEFGQQNPWVIPDEFDSITTTAPVPYGAANTILQLIALAGCTWLTSRGTDGFIQFMHSQAEESPYCGVSMQQELGDPEITIHDRLRSMSVGVYNYALRDTAEIIGTGEYTLSGVQTLTIKYTADYATNVSATVSGGILVSARYYTSYAILIVEAAEESSVVGVTLQGVVIDSTISYLETYRDTTIADGKDVLIENPLITSVEHARLVAEYVKTYYMKRKEYKIPYTGYPQAEAGDMIHLATVYGEDTVEIKSNKIDFNGGWSGVLEVV